MRYINLHLTLTLTLAKLSNGTVGDHFRTTPCFMAAMLRSLNDFSHCFDHHVLQTGNFHEYAVRLIYYVGFSVSIISLAVALFLFIYFR